MKKPFMAEEAATASSAWGRGQAAVIGRGVIARGCVSCLAGKRRVFRPACRQRIRRKVRLARTCPVLSNDGEDTALYG